MSRQTPIPEAIAGNSRTLEAELAWLSIVLEARFENYFASAETADPDFDIRGVRPPDLSGDESEYARLIREEGLGFDERVVLMLALAPHVRPQVLDVFFLQNKILGRQHTEFGGLEGKAHVGFLPTCETAAFVLSGQDLRRRLEVQVLFDDQHAFRRKDIVRTAAAGPHEPFWSSALRLSSETLDRITTGQRHQPDFGMGFPVKRITPRLSWSDLVLPPDVKDEVLHLCAWLAHSREIDRAWGIGKIVKPGYRSLFYGPPGTGKALTASLIGAQAGVDVYRIDLSMVVSNGIGETEKSLANFIDQAESKNWVLFLDEADALFGRLTPANSSTDRHANQEISYLLRRVEDFPGMVILASNREANIDQDFSRRFQSVIHFPMPDVEQRMQLWMGLFPEASRLAPDVDLEFFAERYELAGGALVDVARYAAIRAFRMGREVLLPADLLAGISRELRKEGRSL